MELQLVGCSHQTSSVSERERLAFSRAQVETALQQWRCCFPEVEAVLDQKLRYLSLPELLKEFFLWGRHNYIVSGTHGKTTTTAKLARRLIEQDKKKVMVVSCDVYRPAAIEQLKTLADQVGAVFQPSEVTQKPADIARDALAEARRLIAPGALDD